MHNLLPISLPSHAAATGAPAGRAAGDAPPGRLPAPAAARHPGPQRRARCRLLFQLSASSTGSRPLQRLELDQRGSTAPCTVFIPLEGCLKCTIFHSVRERAKKGRAMSSSSHRAALFARMYTQFPGKHACEAAAGSGGIRASRVTKVTRGHEVSRHGRPSTVVFTCWNDQSFGPSSQLPQRGPVADVGQRPPPRSRRRLAGAGAVGRLLNDPLRGRWPRLLPCHARQQPVRIIGPHHGKEDVVVVLGSGVWGIVQPLLSTNHRRRRRNPATCAHPTRFHHVLCGHRRGWARPHRRRRSRQAPRPGDAGV